MRIARGALAQIVVDRAVGAFVQAVAAAGAMHGPQVHDRGGLLGGMSVDPIVQRQEVAIQFVQRVGRSGVERNLEMI